MTDFTEQSTALASSPTLLSRWAQLRDRHRWLPFVLPFAVFMLFGLFEPPGSTAVPADDSPKATPTQVEDDGSAEPSQEMRLGYPLGYTLRIVATGIAVLLVWPVWRTVPTGSGWLWAVGFGVVGGAMWIGICRLRLEHQLGGVLPLGAWTALGERAAFNPYLAFSDVPVLLAGFLAIRCFGLTVIVPLMEEFFLRGFLMRFVQKPDWWTLSIGSVSWKAAVTATAYGVLAHPAELLAAICWFSWVTLLHARTRSIWNCVLAHAVTNAILGAYILVYRDWTLW